MTIYIDRDEGLFYYLLDDPKWARESNLTPEEIDRIKASDKEFDECQAILQRAWEAGLKH